MLQVAAIVAALTSAQQIQTGAIAGKVMDTSGAVLPGVTITFTGPTTGKAVSRAGGDYRIDNLTPGQYRLDIAAVGFRGTKVDVSVEAGRTASVNTSLRLGVFTLVDYVMPAGVAEAIRESDVVAYVRLTVVAGVRIVNDAMIVTDHDATIESVVKADASSIVAGSSLRFAQDSAGQWVEPGYRATGWEAPYQPGDAFVVFLKRNGDKTLGEYRGNAYMWRVKQGFVIPVNPVGPLPPGLRSPMPVDEALAALRKLAPKNP
jgi:hypothetical protein